MRVLEAGSRTIDDSLVVGRPSGQPHEVIMRGSTSVDTANDQETANRARWVADLGDMRGRSVAWIGGGFCIGPRLLLYGGAVQTVYEIEPALAEFCPRGVTFVPGDWRDTFYGQFDAIIFDLGDAVPYGELRPFLAPGGVILPKEMS